MRKFPSYSWVYVIKRDYKVPYYIGATTNLIARIKRHRGEMAEFHNVEQVYFCNTYRDALYLEAYMWKEFKTVNNWEPPFIVDKNQIECILNDARKLKLRRYMRW